MQTPENTYLSALAGCAALRGKRADSACSGAAGDGAADGDDRQGGHPDVAERAPTVILSVRIQTETIARWWIFNLEWALSRRRR